METKSKRMSVEADNGSGPEERRAWEAMVPEILSMIFKKIEPDDEMVRSVSLVCRGWMETVARPHCWEEINVCRWCQRHWQSTTDSNRLLIDSVVRRLVRRSKSTFKTLSAYRLGNAAFSYAANRGRCLKVLHVPVSEISDGMVIRHAESLISLTDLDISFCLRITSKGVEAFGKHCKSLTCLKRNMPPSDDVAQPDDSEAFAIANSMTGLQHLEFGCARMGDVGLTAIFSGCQALSYLDIEGCFRVNQSWDFEEQSQKLSVLIKPWNGGVRSCDEQTEEDSSIDDYGSS